MPLSLLAAFSLGIDGITSSYPLTMTVDSSDSSIDTPSSSLPSTEMDAGPTIRLILFNHELPSGDVQILLRKLHRYAKSPRFPSLARFLQECTRVLRHEVQKLERPLRGSVPPFNDIVTLASHWDQLRRGPLSGTWEGVFLCVYELGMLIGHHEALGLPYNTHVAGARRQDTHLAGISVGLFSAAAAAVSSTVADLAVYGSECVRVAFAFCVHVGRVSQLLESAAQRPHAEAPPSWASILIGVAAEVVQAELDLFNGTDDGMQDSEAGPLSRISISHVDHASVGITGPPSRIAQLFRQSQVLGQSRYSPLPISGGICHAPNVYDHHDVHAILTTAGVSEAWGSSTVQYPLLSPHTGAPFEAENGCQLVEAICSEALTKPLYFDKLADGLVKQCLRQRQLSDLPYQMFHYRTSLLSDTILSQAADKLFFARLERHDLVDWALQDDVSLDEPRHVPNLPQNAKLAVVGMACRMPGGADTPDKFWQLLVEGRDTHCTVPSDRFDLDTHFDPKDEMENSVGTRFGNFIDNPGYFDAGFFNMSPREAEQTDPMQRLALVTAYEALEMSGFVPNRTPSSHLSRVGTFYGQASDDYREVNACQKIGTYGTPGTVRAFGNGRINYFFKFSGPSFNVDTACSSGLTAVHAACLALWSGEADTVVAGGLNVITNPDIYCMLSKGHFLSKTGQCKVWDAGADGYCRADGIGSVVIKRLEDAMADNDHVLATIVAGATNHSAESVSITQPHSGAQMSNYSRVLHQAGVDPLDVSFVELHGTGTQVGDAVESESVLNYFAPLGRRQQPDQRLYLGAVKSNIGHGEAAAGIASLIKVLLMYRHGVIPRHIGIKTKMNPVVAKHLADRNAGIVSKNSPWLPMPNARRRYSAVNSFGAHGGNTTLLLEDGPSSHVPAAKPDDDDDDPSSSKATICEVISISAKSKVSLRGNIRALLSYLEVNPETDLGDLSYTLCARRIHHHMRIAASVFNTKKLEQLLRDIGDDVDSHVTHVASAAQSSVVFAFSGQGSFSRGAAATLLQRAPAFRDRLLELDRVVCQLGFPSVMTAISGCGGDDVAPRQSSRQGPDDDTITTSKSSTGETPLVTQLSVVVIQIALIHYWELLGIKPNVVIGHSLGEFAAFVAAGVLSAADAIYLVGKRAQLMMSTCEAGSHAMLSVRGATSDEIQLLCPTGRYSVSCLNGSRDIVLSGLRHNMKDLLGVLQDAGHKCLLLDVPFAFHSAQLDPLLEVYEKMARRITFKAPSIPVISPLLKQCVFEHGVINETYLRRATREPVDFVAALDVAKADGLVDSKTAWIDIGLHPAATSFARNHYEKGTTRVFASLRQGDDVLSSLTTSLAALHCLGLPVAWNEYFAFGPDDRRFRLLHLETYQWNHKNYWIQYDGTWTLDKAHGQAGKNSQSITSPSFSTSSVQQIIAQDFDEFTGRMIALSDLGHPDLRRAADGHKINGRSVITGSIWADITLTVGEYLFKRMMPDSGKPFMDVRNMEVSEAQVLHANDSNSPAQFIRIEGTMDSQKKQTRVAFYKATSDGSVQAEKAFAVATVCYEDGQTWRNEWQIASHLVATRASSLWKSAESTETGHGRYSRVSELSRDIIYQLFGNVVDYGMQYRGMHRAALCENQEATADIVLDADRHGTWHTPPHWIDSTFQLAGFVMNAFGVQGEGPAAGSSRDFFYITPGWSHLRIAEQLEPGPHVTYRNYVHMFPVEGQPGTFAGDIYLLRGEKVVGACTGIKFKRIPRAFMAVMFPRHEAQGQSRTQISGASGIGKSSGSTIDGRRHTGLTVPPASAWTNGVQGKNQMKDEVAAAKHPAPTPRVTGSQTKTDADEANFSRSEACLQLVADEMGLDLEDLSGEAAFADLGVDSLMSLALSGKLRSKLGIDVQASIFLECPKVVDLVNWLSK